MKTTSGILAAACVLAMACRGNGNLTRKNQQYDVVQEGSANGVTSTINAPGETAPPVDNTPITGTGPNADTTTAFTLPTATEGAPTGPGNLAGTLPTSDSSGRMSSGMLTVPASPAPRTTTAVVRPRPSQTTRTTQTPPTPPPQQAPPAPTTATAEPQPPPTNTAVTSTTTTSTDTQPPPPPPPPPPSG